MGVGITYLTIPVDSADEAQSLANYLNEHGVCAFQQSTNEVNIPLENSDTQIRIDLLKQTWAMFWEHSDGMLMDLQIYVKD